jgi:hypothetical protein
VDGGIDHSCHTASGCSDSLPRRKGPCPKRQDLKPSETYEAMSSLAAFTPHCWRGFAGLTGKS